eukprot:1295066-Pleurochrysis_carterae.AAC.1
MPPAEKSVVYTKEEVAADFRKAMAEAVARLKELGYPPRGYGNNDWLRSLGINIATWARNFATGSEGMNLCKGKTSRFIDGMTLADIPMPSA